MSTKRIWRWSIVLFLLAALPAMTAVVAQEQELEVPAETAMEQGEVAVTIPWSNTESEPNNGMAAADPFYRVMGGILNDHNDVDYFKIYPLIFNNYLCGDSNSPILIDIEAKSIGPLEVYIDLIAPDGTYLESDWYGSGEDPMLYYNLYPGNFCGGGEPYYLAVGGDSGEGANARYQILVSNPLLISAASGGLGTGNVDGIPFQAGDVLAWSQFNVGNTTYEKWNMLLDLSDLGIKGNITNLAGGWRNSDFLLLGFAGNVTLPGVQRVVTPWDVVKFDPSNVGDNTAGTFEAWWAGSNHGLTTAAEKLDAIDWPNWSGSARLFTSTGGTAAVNGGGPKPLKLADEDVGRWGPTEIWASIVDQSTVAGMATEDVIGLSVSELDVDWGEDSGFSNFWVYNMVIQGTAQCGPTPQLITQKDIYRHVVEQNFDWQWDEWWYTYPCQVVWHGPDHGWNYNIDAIEYYSGVPWN